MRVLFVYPNLYTQMGFNHGLASLSAVLKRAGHETSLVNLNERLPPVPSDEDVWKEVVTSGARLVAFSCLTQQYAAGVELARFLRRRAFEDGVAPPVLVVGGIHPTLVPSEVMADGVWDHVGVGECEDALLELVTRIERGESPCNVSNLLSWKDGVRPDLADDAPVAPEHWIHNRVGEFPDLAALPMPDYALFDTQRITDQKHGWFGLMTSRGCPYRCTYCLNHKIVDRYRAELDRKVSDLEFFRYRKPEDAVEEVRWVLEHYSRISTFIIDDDLFTHNADHAVAFCEAYERAGIQVPFVVNAHVKAVEPRVARALSKAGCRILKLGIESGSLRVRREVLKRYMSQEDILATVASAEEHRLHTSGFLMVGLPTETMDELWESVDLLASSRIGRFRTSFFFPFPGTGGYEQAIAAGHVTREAIGSLTTFTDGSCLDFGAAQNLFVDKLGRAMPWFVNARMARFHEDAPVSRRYAPLVERVLAMDAAAWKAFYPTIAEVDAEYSSAASAAGELHYAIRYERSMGVRSDYFLAEDAGIEWATAAAKPNSRDQLLALASAASEAC